MAPHLAPDEESQDEQGGPLSEYASTEEARAAIEALTDSDYERLMLVASIHRKHRRLGDQMTAEELLSEAIVRTLRPTGRVRRWRKAVVPIVQHLDRTMESVSGHAVAKAKEESDMREALAVEDLDPQAKASRRLHAADTTQWLLAVEELEELKRRFAGAPAALAYLRLRAEGYSESEITARLGMDKRMYEAARKKAEREIAKYAVETGRREEP